MLKNVVLPAPLGPMIETIERRGTSRSHVVDGDEAAEHLGDVLGAQRAAVAVGAPVLALIAAARSPRAARPPAPMPSVELELAPSLGDQALRAQHHHDHEQEAEDPERRAR